MHATIAIFALLIAAFGWYYLFYSRAAQNLGAIEDQQSNRRRGLLRRVNAVVMLLMALGIAFGTYRFDADHDEIAYFLIWTGVIALLGVCVVLALIDVRLTMKLRERIRERK